MNTNRKMRHQLLIKLIYYCLSRSRCTTKREKGYRVHSVREREREREREKERERVRREQSHQQPHPNPKGIKSHLFFTKQEGEEKNKNLARLSLDDFPQNNSRITCIAPPLRNSSTSTFHHPAPPPPHLVLCFFNPTKASSLKTRGL